jgi:hypothetical protein
MWKPLRRLILDRLGLAHSSTFGITAAQVTFVCKAEVCIKTHGSNGARRHAHFTADALIVIEEDMTGLRVAMNGVFRTGRHARGVGALLAGDGKMEIAGVAATAQHLNSGPCSPLLPRMFPGTSPFALPATSTLGRVDRKKPGSDHFDDLLPSPVLDLKVLGGLLVFVLIASQPILSWKATIPGAMSFFIMNDIIYIINLDKKACQQK